MNEKGSISIHTENIFPIIKKWLYSEKDIFIREIVSNAADAISKLKKLSGMGEASLPEGYRPRIDVVVNKEKGTISVTDNGIGMTDEEVKKYINQIAFSGAKDFIEKYKDKTDDQQIIGHFGLGFYSAFMVAKSVRVVSRAFDSEQAYEWQSAGADGYTIAPTERAEAGTDVILTLKEDTEEEKYGQYLEEYTLSSLVKKYSDYIRYPIRMEVEKSRLKEGSESEYEQYKEDSVLNSMTPLWKKSKAELTDEDYNQFYMDKFHDFEPPLLRIHTSVEGAVSYNALLFIPKRPPYDFYSKEYKRGLQLYTSGVMIMDKCEDLLPDYFGFVRGLVDSADLSLNISREMLQHDRQLQLISRSLERRIRGDLQKLLKEDREKYEAFWKAFGLQLKYGVYSSFGQLKDSLADLLLFHSSTQGGLVTLAEYLDRMKEGQTAIYYACGGSVQAIDQAKTVAAQIAGVREAVADELGDRRETQRRQRQRPGVGSARHVAEQRPHRMCGRDLVVARGTDHE